MLQMKGLLQKKKEAAAKKRIAVNKKRVAANKKVAANKNRVAVRAHLPGLFLEFTALSPRCLVCRHVLHSLWQGKS